MHNDSNFIKRTNIKYETQLTRQNSFFLFKNKQLYSYYRIVFMLTMQ